MTNSATCKIGKWRTLNERVKNQDLPSENITIEQHKTTVLQLTNFTNYHHN